MESASISDGLSLYKYSKLVSELIFSTGFKQKIFWMQDKGVVP
jgi:hypothetical protein